VLTFGTVTVKAIVRNTMKQGMHYHVEIFLFLSCNRLYNRHFLWTALFRVVTQRVVLIFYRRFEITCRSHIQVSRIQNASWFQTFAVFWMLYVFFWVIPRRLNFICRRFGTLCMFHLHRQVGVKNELGLRNVGVFIREKVWLENSPPPYWLRLFSSQTFSRINTQTFLKPSSFFTPTCLWRWNRVVRNVGI
jgi:hypothetical protein